LDVENARVALEQSREDLEEALLTAPFAGVIAKVNLQEGTQPATGRPAITLVDDSNYYVEVTVDETDIGKVEEGQPVEITLDAYPNVVVEGEIETIAPAPEDGNGAGLVSYPVRVVLHPTDEIEVRDGMTANVVIRTQVISDILLVPNWSVRTDQSSGETYTYCYCLRDGVPQRTPVTVGARNETYTQILSGLEEGDRVALVTEERGPLFELGNGPPGGGRP
jgi:RND family efflux transporter MFP subunit